MTGTIEERLRRVETGLADIPSMQNQPFETDERALPISGLELVAADRTSGATKVTLRFVAPEGTSVDHFEVWVNRTAYQSEEPYKVADLRESPAAFTVNADQDTNVVAYVRTVMQNGLGTGLFASPSVTFPVYKFVANSEDIAEAAITNSKLLRVGTDRVLIQNADIDRASVNKLVVGTADIEDLAVTNAKIGDLDAGKITTGILDALLIDVIHLNATNITTGSLSGITMSLNSNGVTTTVDNSALSILGAARFTGLKTKQNSDNRIFSAICPSIVTVGGPSSGGYATMECLSGYGTLSVGNSLGTETARITGSTGDIACQSVTVGGSAGLGGSVGYLYSLTYNTVTIQYKDWGGANASAVLVTLINPLAATLGFTGGIRTS